MKVVGVALTNFLSPLCLQQNTTFAINSCSQPLLFTKLLFSLNCNSQHPRFLHLANYADELRANHTALTI
jgi:hypothetical protein